MPLPEGLVVPDSEYELEPDGPPVVVGVFMEEVSPRTLLVGTRARVNYAFDVQGSRFSAVTCRHCSYTEFFKTPTSMLGNVFDFMTQ